MTAKQDQSPNPGAIVSPSVQAQKTTSFAARIGRDLLPRVVSSVVMAVVAIGALWSGSLPTSALAACVLVAVAWEWGRIVRSEGQDLTVLIHSATILVVLYLTATGERRSALLIAIVGTLSVMALNLSRHPIFSAIGVLVTALPGLALVWLRADADYGLPAVLFIATAVAATDIAAYFCGRLIGGPKLWPRISPNKTWAGLIGGMTAASLAGAATGMMVEGATALHLAELGGALACVAQAGDLAESALKRHFGAKDASHLIPGHGGFMDRIDGLTAALLMVAALAVALGPASPARAVLTW